MENIPVKCTLCTEESNKQHRTNYAIFYSGAIELLKNSVHIK